ncbi:MAG: trehalase family glycosidase [Kiritimatiellae bacterium]|nr:trehalase family glycosidase [Kiritimatiellia bacterium]
MAQNIVKTAEEYVCRITARKGHFSFLEAGKNRVAVFRRLSFIPPDDVSMIRGRLAPDITPKIKTSVLNGFLIGEVRVNGQGHITRGLDANRRALLDYMLGEPMGAHVVEKLGTRLFKIHYPGALLEVLIARATRLTGAQPVTAIRNHRWHVRVGNIRFEVERFLEFCLVHARMEQFFALIKADEEERGRFIQLPRPCILIAFGRTVDVAGTMNAAPEKQNQLSDRAFFRLFQAYEGSESLNKLVKEMLFPLAAKSVKPVFLSGRRFKLSPRWPLPENTSLPITRVKIPEVVVPAEMKRSVSKLTVHIPAVRGRELLQTMALQEYEYLTGCVLPGRVECRLGGRRLVGRITTEDQTIYPPIWSLDHFCNCFPMMDFNLPLAKDMILGGLIHFMELKGEQRGQIKLAKRKDNKITTTYPIWAPLIQQYFARTGDQKFLKQVWPFLQLNDAYLDRFYLRDGIYVGPEGFGQWNDYSSGPKTLPFIASIGLNSMIALQKKIMFELGMELGFQDERLRKNFENLKEQINNHFWDDRLGFYFDYDHDRKRIYTTIRGRRFFGLDNLLPLFAGIVPQERIESITRYLTSSRHYGKYPAITTDLSDDFMDERRLMIWVISGWLVIQGLRNYRQHAIADGIARRIFNAFLKNWSQAHVLSEALSGPFGLAPMENSTLAGVGCWTGFYLYLQEAFRDQGSASKGTAL